MSLFCCPKQPLTLWICLHDIACLKSLLFSCVFLSCVLCGLVLHCSRQWVLTAECSEFISAAWFVSSFNVSSCICGCPHSGQFSCTEPCVPNALLLIRALLSICLLIVSALTVLLLIPNSSIWPKFGPSSSILNLCSVVLELRWLIPGSQAEDHSSQCGAIWIILPHSVGATGYDCCIIKYGCKSRHSGCPSLFNCESKLYLNCLDTDNEQGGEEMNLPRRFRSLLFTHKPAGCKIG